MTRETVQTSLRFAGDWPWYAGVSAAALLAIVAWLLYRRDVARMPFWLRALLPMLRALAIAMAVLMLAGPVLHHRKVIGELSQLLLFVDASRSMDLTDSSMDLGRKIRVLQRLGHLPEGSVKLELPQAAETLGEALALVDKVKASPNAQTSDWSRLLGDFAAKIDETRDLLSKAGELGGRFEMFGKDLALPAREIASREMRQTNDRKKATADLARLGDVAARWQAELSELFKKNVAETAESSSPLAAALRRFDTLPRWQRLQAMLLEGKESKLLQKLAETHDVQLLVLRGGAAEKLWQPTSRDSSLPAALPKPAGEITNLATGLKTLVGDGEDEEQRGAAVIFSDGQHNEGESPVEVAKLFAGRQMPVFTVGFGSTAKPRDLAVLKVHGPESVFAEDRVRGHVVLKDDVTAGQPFTVTVKDGDKPLWEQRFFTEGKGQRLVPFDFPISDLVKARMKNQREGVEVSGVPIDVKVAVSAVEGDREMANNEGSLRVRAVTQRRKILLLDGRARWETRYLKNMFERDEQWELSAVIAGATRSEPGFVRGEKPEQFPNDPALVQPFDLIVFGEIPRALWRGEELQWISDFVAKRGGAIVFIDGPRGALKEYADTPLGPLLPVEWKGREVRERVSRLLLPERTQGLAPFALVPERAQNADVWQSLKTPHWLSGATPLPGAEVLIEADAGAAGKVPAVVFRPFGAGRVVYHAFDDSWRWRYEVADQYHVKYWNQVANWIAEIPFAVRDKFISLDAGAITYRPGDSADLRVRLRDGEGKPVTNTVVDAVLTRNGERVAAIRLAPDDNAGGLFRGKTAALEPGEYEVSVESVAIAQRDTKARTSFKVEPRETGELTQLNVNEDLLRQMSAAGGGQYLREENISRLAELLAPMSQGQVIETDTPLWQSWWWFLPIVALLTIEWILRKRAGML